MKSILFLSCISLKNDGNSRCRIAETIAYYLDVGSVSRGWMRRMRRMRTRMRTRTLLTCDSLNENKEGRLTGSLLVWYAGLHQSGIHT